jgi:hypothetical protein
MSGGVRDPRYHDPLGKPLSPNLLYVKLGYQHDFFNFGRTAIGVDWVQQDDLIFNGDVAHGYSIGLVQNIDKTATELFFTVQRETLTRSLGLNDKFFPILAGWVGARIRF